MYSSSSVIRSPRDPSNTIAIHHYAGKGSTLNGLNPIPGITYTINKYNTMVIVMPRATRLFENGFIVNTDFVRERAGRSKRCVPSL